MAKLYMSSSIFYSYVRYVVHDSIIYGGCVIFGEPLESSASYLVVSLKQPRTPFAYHKANSAVSTYHAGGIVASAISCLFCLDQFPPKKRPPVEGHDITSAPSFSVFFQLRFSDFCVTRAMSLQLSPL